MSSIVGVQSPDQQVPLENIWGALDENIRVAPRVNVGDQGTYAGALFSIDNCTSAQAVSILQDRGSRLSPKELSFRTHDLSGRPFLEIHTRIPPGESVIGVMTRLRLRRMSTRIAVAGTTIFWEDVGRYRNIEKSISGKLWLAVCGDITRVLVNTLQGRRYNQIGVGNGFPEGWWGFAQWMDETIEKHDDHFGEGADIPTVYYIAGIEFSGGSPRVLALQHDSEPPFRMFETHNKGGFFVASSQEGAHVLVSGLENVPEYPECVPPMTVLRREGLSFVPRRLERI